MDFRTIPIHGVETVIPMPRTAKRRWARRNMVFGGWAIAGFMFVSALWWFLIAIDEIVTWFAS